MKSHLLFLLVLFTSIICCAQTFDGEAGNDWNEPMNWEGDAVPLPTGNVIIPDGFDVVANIGINISSLALQGTASLTTNNNLVYDNLLTIDQDATLNWNGGALSGPNLTPSVLTNDGTINVYGFLQISRIDLTNNGSIHFQSGQQFVINAEATLTNSNVGLIEFTTPGTTSSNPGGGPSNIINNGTLIVSHQGTSEITTLSSQFENNNLIIVESGTLRLFSNLIQLNSGTLNITSDGELLIDNTVNLSGNINGVVNGIIDWNSKINVDSSATLNLSGNGNIEANLANLDGLGVLTTNFDVNVVNSIFMLNEVEWINNGTINLEDNSNINMAASSRLENTLNGIIDFTGNGASFSVSSAASSLENLGLIKATLPNTTDEASMAANLINMNGEISVETGVLRLGFGPAQLQYQDGVYNVMEDGILNFNGNNTINGTLSGNIEGKLNFQGDIYVPTESNLQFFVGGVSGRFNFDGFDLRGGGVLFNETNVWILGNNPSTILEFSTLENLFDITFLENSNLRIGVDSNVINAINGEMYFFGDNSQISRFGTGNNVLENYGEIYTLETNINVRIGAFTYNYGDIYVNDGSEFWFDQYLNNGNQGYIYGDNGTFRLPSVAANFVNNGRISAGYNGVGQLNLINQYTSTSTAVIQAVLSGDVQSVDYDYIDIQGDAVFEGNIEVFLDEYSPSEGQEFVIATTTGTILSCNLPSSVAMPEGGNVFLEYLIECRNDNELVITYNGVLNTDEFNRNPFKVYPNPFDGLLTIDVPENESIASVAILDLNGKTLTKIEHNPLNDGNELDLSYLSDGIYFLEIKSDEKIYRKKIIKN